MLNPAIGRRQESQGKRSLIESKIDEARRLINNAQSSRDLSRAIEALREASERMRDGYQQGFGISYALTTSQGRLLKDDRDACANAWKEARDLVETRRREIHQHNYDHFHRRAEEAYNQAHSGDAREAKNEVKQIHVEMKGKSMSGEQFQIIRDLLNQAWETATSRQRVKHEEWRRRTEEFIDRAEALIDKNLGVIARLEAQKEHCWGLIADARTIEFEQMVQGWIDEKNEKIADIERTNHEVRGKIDDARSRLNS